MLVRLPFMNATTKKSVERTFIFNYKTFTLRIDKIKRSIQTTIVDGPVLLGGGIMSVFDIWFDNGFAALLVSSGVLGLAILAIFVLIPFFLLNAS